MKISIWPIFAVALLLSGCGKNNDDFIGLYQYTSEGNRAEAVLEIKKEDGIYLLSRNVLENTKTHPLLENSDGLSINGNSLSLSDSSKILYLSSIKGKRITVTELEQIKAERTKLKEFCLKLQKEINAKKDTLDTESWNAYVRSYDRSKASGCKLDLSIIW